MAFRTSATPIWRPRQTSDTVLDVPEKVPAAGSLSALLIKFGLNAINITIAGIVVADMTGMSETAAGGLLSGVAHRSPNW